MTNNVLKILKRGYPNADSVAGLVKIFADDTKLFSSIKSKEDCKKLQADLESLSQWSDRWLLRFNVSKCGVMHYGLQKEEQYTYTMHEEGIERALGVLQEEKDLGVMFDPTLRFSKHVSTVANKANRILGVMKRTFSFMDNKMLTTLYKTLVRPHVEYANCVWHPFLQNDIQTIEKVQRRATKLTSDVKDFEYPERLRKLKLPTLAYRRLRGDMIQVYKIVHELIGIKKEILFIMGNVETGTRGNIFKLQKARFTIKTRENAFSNRVVNTWNKLPDEVVNAKSVNEFKSGVDSALSKYIDKYTYGLGPKWQQGLKDQDIAS